MTAAPDAPTRGIRLAGDAAIPPAPSLGDYRPVTHRGHHIGSVLEVTPGHHIPVCAPGCYQPLPARPTYLQGKVALRAHWAHEHAGRVA